MWRNTSGGPMAVRVAQIEATTVNASVSSRLEKKRAHRQRAREFIESDPGSVLIAMSIVARPTSTAMDKLIQM